jgi:peptidoglycan/LPS O-acetylase OafA/YrhL
VTVHDLVDGVNQYVKRFMRLSIVLMDMHIEVMQRELDREQQRITAGSALVGFGLALVAGAILLLQVATVMVARWLGLPWLGAVLAVALLNLIPGFLFVSAGLRRLQGPYMVETRSRLMSTTTTLLGKEPQPNVSSVKNSNS